MVLESATLLRAAVVVTVGVTVGFGIYLVGGSRLRSTLTDRFLCGVPWGSLLVVAGVVSFYLFAQSGLRHWNEPVTVAFRNWSYLYPDGLVFSGFAHGSPSHLLGNLLATVVLAPIAEFVWGHYPGHAGRSAELTATTDPPDSPAPAEFDATPAGGIPGGSVADAGLDSDPRHDARAVADSPRRLRDRPVIRAFVLFPGVVLAVSLLTSLYAFGWSLGFSGTVFAFLGFVLVRYPIPTALALLGVSLLNTLSTALAEPVLRVGLETGPPTPPGWAGVNVQAHLLGFLVGALLAVALVWRRGWRPEPARLLLATVLVGFAQGLWQLSTASGDQFVRYQGLGVVFVLLLAVLLTYVAASERVQFTGWVPTVIRGVALLWLVLVAAGALAAPAVFGTDPMTLATVGALAPVLALPGALLVVPDGLFRWPLSTRRTLFVSLVVIAVIVALPSAVANSIGIDDDPVPDGSLAVEDYHVSYGESLTNARTGGNNSGVVVVSEERYVWTVAVDAAVLEHDGSATVPVGDVGWREAVAVERTGWSVVGNDSVYAVDLETDEESLRSFVSDPSTAEVTVEGHEITLAPTEEAFRLNVTRDGEFVDSVAVPEVNETAAAGSLVFMTEQRNGTEVLFVEADRSRLAVAEAD